MRTFHADAKRVLVFCVLAAAAAWLSPPALAQVQWTKHHLRVTEPNSGAFIAEMSIISNTTSPYSIRVLLEDSAHRHVVIRHTVEGNLFDRTFELLDTGEVLSLSSDGAEPATILVSYGADSFSFLDGDESSPAVQQEAAALISNASAALREALREYARLGARYVSDLEDVARVYEDLFFADDPSLDGDRLVVQAEKSDVAPFDPARTPPSAFEEQFGSAYFE